MPKFTPVVSKSLFKEKSLDEYLKPYLLAKAEYEKDKTARDAEIEGIAKFDPYLNEDTKKANAISSQTKDYIQNAIDWMGTPYYHANRSSLLAAKKKYQDNSNILLGGATGLTDFQKTQAELNAKDPTRRTGYYRPDGTFTEKPNIDDFLYNKNLAVYDMSGEQVRTDWQKFGAALTGRFSWARSGIGGNVLTRYNPQTNKYEAMTDADGNPIQILVSTNEKQHGVNGQITTYDLITGFANWTEGDKKKFLTNQPELRELFENNDIPRMWDELHSNDMFLHLKPEDQKYMEERAMTGLLQGLNLYDEQRSTSASFVPTGGRSGSGSGSGVITTPENTEVSRSTEAEKREKWEYQDTEIQATDITDDDSKGDVKTAEQVKVEATLKPLMDILPEMMDAISEKAKDNPDVAKLILKEAKDSILSDIREEAKKKGILPTTGYGNPGAAGELQRQNEKYQKFAREELKKRFGVETPDDLFNEDGSINSEVVDNLIDKVDANRILDKLIDNAKLDSITEYVWNNNATFPVIGGLVHAVDQISRLFNASSFGLSPELQEKFKNTVKGIENAGINIEDLFETHKIESEKTNKIKEASQYMPGKTTYEQAANYQQLRKIRSDSQVYSYDPMKIAGNSTANEWLQEGHRVFDFNTKDSDLDVLHANSGVFMPDGTQIRPDSDGKIDLGDIKVDEKDFWEKGIINMKPSSPTGWANSYKGVSYPIATSNDLYRQTGKYIHDATAALENTNFNKDNTLVLKLSDRTADGGFDKKIEFLGGAHKEAMNILMAENTSKEQKQKELEELSKKYEEYINELTDKNGKYGKYAQVIGEPNSPNSGYAFNICTEDAHGDKQIEIMLFTKDFRNFMTYNPMKDLTGSKLNDMERDACTYAYNTIALRSNFKFDFNK